MSSARKRTVFYQTVRRGRLQTMLDEVEIIPVLHKVTGAGHGCKGGGGGGGGRSVRVQSCVGFKRGGGGGGGLGGGARTGGSSASWQPDGWSSILYYIYISSYIITVMLGLLYC